MRLRASRITSCEDVAILDLPLWPRDFFFAGDRLALNKLLSRAQEAGSVEFETHYDTLAEVTAGNVTVTLGLAKLIPEEYLKSFAKGLSESCLAGGFNLPTDKCRNKLLAQMPYIGVQDMLEA